MSGTGFGIAGHKNSYSTSVRCGNWVEDTIGHALAEGRREQAMEYTTEARRNFIDPRLMEEDPHASGVKIPSLVEITVKSREGLSWNVMFAHGEEQQASDKYQTSNAEQFQVRDDDETSGEQRSVVTERMMQREKHLRQEEREMRMTSKQAADKHIKKLAQREMTEEEKNAEAAVPLPDARRPESFTQSIPKWF